MRKTIGLVTGFLLSLNIVFGEFQPSKQFQTKVENAKENLMKKIDNKPVKELKKINKNFEKAIDNYSANKKIQYALKKIKKTIENKINIKTGNIKMDLKKKKKFIRKHGKNISSNSNKIPTKCKNNYDLIDNIAKKRNFPTAFIIATWYREANCRMVNPENGNGPFQIRSHYYKPGDISKKQFKKIVNNYIDFAKAKQRYYNNNENLKEEFGKPINLGYNKYNLRSLRLQAVLYNGLTSDNRPKISYYANGNLNDNFSDAIRDGVVTMFIKVSKREIKNRKIQ